MPRLSIDLTVAQQRALGKLATVYGCDARELAGVAVTEMLAAHRRPRPVRKPRKAGRRTVSAPRGRAVKPASAPRRCASPPVSAPPRAAAARTYQPKACAACGKDFIPTGARSTVCDRCKSDFAAEGGTGRPRTRPRPEPEPEYETVWNGSVSKRHNSAEASV
jgi:hypothetical protein